MRLLIFICSCNIWLYVYSLKDIYNSQGESRVQEIKVGSRLQFRLTASPEGSDMQLQLSILLMN